MDSVYLVMVVWNGDRLFSVQKTDQLGQVLYQKVIPGPGYYLLARKWACLSSVREFVSGIVHSFKTEVMLAKRYVSGW